MVASAMNGMLKMMFFCYIVILRNASMSTHHGLVWQSVGLSSCFYHYKRYSVVLHLGVFFRFITGLNKCYVQGSYLLLNIRSKIGTIGFSGSRYILFGFS